MLLTMTFNAAVPDFINKASIENMSKTSLQSGSVSLSRTTDFLSGFAWFCKIIDWNNWKNPNRKISKNVGFYYHRWSRQILLLLLLLLLFKG